MDFLTEVYSIEAARKLTKENRDKLVGLEISKISKKIVKAAAEGEDCIVLENIRYAETFEAFEKEGYKIVTNDFGAGISLSW